MSGRPTKASATIEFSGGTRTLDAASSITGNAFVRRRNDNGPNGGVGTGLMSVAGGTATFNRHGKYGFADQSPPVLSTARGR